MEIFLNEQIWIQKGQSKRAVSRSNRMPGTGNALRKSITCNYHVARFFNFQVLANCAHLQKSIASRGAYFDLTTV